MASQDEWDKDSIEGSDDFDFDELIEDVRQQVIDYLKEEGPKIIQQEVKRQVTALIKSEIGLLKRQGAQLDLTQVDCSSSPVKESTKSLKTSTVKKNKK